MTTASAGATFQLSSISGKFHGAMAATTPGRLEPGVGVVAGVHRQRFAGGEPGVVGEEPVVRRGARPS
jgi:hypothetical protein